MYGIALRLRGVIRRWTIGGVPSGHGLGLQRYSGSVSLQPATAPVGIVNQHVSKNGCISFHRHPDGVMGGTDNSAGVET